MEADEAAPGRFIAGKYRVERALGQGGMAEVVVALHVKLNERVAVKILSQAARQSADAVRRFEREARLAARIRNEHVVRVLDVGNLDSGAPYLVMEFLEGEDLASWLRRCGRASAEQAVDFVLQTCVALADAHALGVIHRDLKPANLFCVRRSDGKLVIKVLDFGISKVLPADSNLDGSDVGVTKTSALLGTPLYMSPEQAQSAKHVDVRTDIWSLGVVLFELLTGAPPFPGESFGDVVFKIASEQTPSLEAVRQSTPRGLDAVVRRCLEKRREDRFANVEELALALAPFAPKHGAIWVEQVCGIFAAQRASGSHPAVDARGQAAAPVTAWSGLELVIRQVRQRKAAVATLVGLSLVGAGASALILSRTSSESLTRDVAAPTLRGEISAASADAAQADVRAQPPRGATAEPSAVPTAVDATPADPVASSQIPRPSAQRGSAAPQPFAKPRAGAAASGVSALTPQLKANVASAGASAKAAATRADPCQPPYFIDDQGRKHFNRNCYANGAH